jgi:hypothetical protein
MEFVHLSPNLNGWYAIRNVYRVRLVKGVQIRGHFCLICVPLTEIDVRQKVTVQLQYILHTHWPPIGLE